MKRCLVINPNMTEAVTALVVEACQRRQPGVRWEGVTARTGAPYIADEVAYVHGAHAALDMLAQTYDGHDAVLVACFGDPGLLALRQSSHVPVLGLTSASLQAAARHGRFAIVTGGTDSVPMLERFTRAHRLDTHLSGIYAIEWTGLHIAADPEGACEALLAAAQQDVEDGAALILLSGAALAGLADQLQPRMAVPVLDSIVLSAQAVVEALA